MNIRYFIKPRLYIENQNLWCFSDELHQLTISELQDIIGSCEDVMNNEGKELYWGWNVSSLDMKKKTTILSYNGQFEAEIPTIEIYNMLKAYRDKLREYESSNTN